MTKIIMVLGVVALLAVVGIFMGVANAKSAVGELTIDAKFVAFFPDRSANLPEGVPYYSVLDIFKEGEIGGVPIGEGHLMNMATEPIGTSGTISRWVVRIFGEGEIHLSTGPRIGPAPQLGAIIGGTEIYRGASGDFSRETIGGGELRITFHFQPASVGGATAFLVGGPGSSVFGWVILVSLGATGVAVLAGGGWYSRQRKSNHR